MEQRPEYEVVLAPREGVNDDKMRLLDWLVAEGALVNVKTALAVMETTKSTFELEANVVGHVFRLVEAGAEVSVGAPVAMIAQRPQRPTFTPSATSHVARAYDGPFQDQVITGKAEALIKKY